jgi:Calcineurin-like phosphoesterase
MERIILVHLSDIHIGSIRNGFYNPASVRGGLNGHYPLALGRLQQAILNLPGDLGGIDADERLNFVVSGDLSCSGLFTDLVLAHSYLRGLLVNDYAAADVVGLSIPHGCFATVPGNHDHWNGKSQYPQPAYSRAIFGQAFKQTPWPMTLRSKQRNPKLYLDLFGVDSNSGLSHLPDNGTAYGDFSQDELFHPVRGLEQLLIQSDGMRAGLPIGVHLMRAIVCHHSFSNRGRPTPNMPRPSLWRRAGNRVLQHFFGKMPDPLDPAAVNALLGLAHKYDVRAVLTGHTHYIWEERFPPAPAAPFTWELRSGTALQGSLANGDQEFLVHEIRLQDKAAAPEWRYRRYTYARGKFNPGPWAIAQ